MSDMAIICINLVCVSIILTQIAILMLTTRRRSLLTNIALWISVTTIPVILYNMSRSTEIWWLATKLVYLAIVINTTLLPLLWILVYKEFHPRWKFRPVDCIHFVPSAYMLLMSLVALIPMTSNELLDFIQQETTEQHNSLWIINFVILSFQMCLYFPLIIIQFRKIRRNTPPIQLPLYVGWMRKTILLFAAFFLVIMIACALYPECDAWLIAILDAVILSYLNSQIFIHAQIDLMKDYYSMSHPVEPSTVSVPPEAFPPFPSAKREGETVNHLNILATHNFAHRATKPTLTQEQMKQNCEELMQYLLETQAFLQPSCSLHQVVEATGITENNLSKSINSFRHQNFSELINTLRIEKAKHMLCELHTSKYTIDSIIPLCGFRSKSTFYVAFKKVEGVSPAQWLIQHIQQQTS